MPWFFALFGFLAFFVGLFVQGWFFIYRGGTRYIWRRPSWYENPFSNPFMHTQPLQFFHMGGFAFMAMGLVMLASGRWDWSRGVPSALIVFGSGLGVWTYVSAFCLVFGRKMEG